jgi:hypothetical protein
VFCSASPMRDHLSAATAPRWARAAWRNDGADRASALGSSRCPWRCLRGLAIGCSAPHLWLVRAVGWRCQYQVVVVIAVVVRAAETNPVIDADARTGTPPPELSQPVNTPSANLPRQVERMFHRVMASGLLSAFLPAIPGCR